MSWDAAAARSDIFGSRAILNLNERSARSAAVGDEATPWIRRYQLQDERRRAVAARRPLVGCRAPLVTGVDRPVREAALRLSTRSGVNEGN